MRSDIAKNSKLDQEDRSKLFAWVDKLEAGEVLLEGEGGYFQVDVTNLHISRCRSCTRTALWVRDKLIHPQRQYVIVPNPDLPPHIARDFIEASDILDRSPRGAAALLRLAIQKLCHHLGATQDRIDDAIASLHAKGLSPVVGQALDYVRVIGNNAVHPGTIDLQDDHATAEQLFKLVNLITEQTITAPKHVSQLFSSLPEGVQKAIENRNARALGKVETTNEQ